MSKITYRFFEANNNSVEKEVFFNWALNNMLYRSPLIEENIRKEYNSRLKANYLNQRETKDISAIIAFDKNKPVGISLCENNLFKRSCDLVNPTKVKRKIIRKLDAEYICFGFLSFYVLPEYRKKGIAKKLVKQMELLKMPLALANQEKKISVMTFMAREDARHVIHTSDFSYPVYDEYQMFFDKLGAMVCEYIYPDNMYNHLVQSNFKKEPSLDVVENNKILKITLKSLLKKGINVNEKQNGVKYAK